LGLSIDEENEELERNEDLPTLENNEDDMEAVD
jgi:hypothetical protein